MTGVLTRNYIFQKPMRPASSLHFRVHEPIRRRGEAASPFLTPWFPERGSGRRRHIGRAEVRDTALRTAASAPCCTWRTIWKVSVAQSKRARGAGCARCAQRACAARRVARPGASPREAANPCSCPAVIEQLPLDLRDRFTEMREMDLQVQSTCRPARTHARTRAPPEAKAALDEQIPLLGTFGSSSEVQSLRFRWEQRAACGVAPSLLSVLQMPPTSWSRRSTSSS